MYNILETLSLYNTKPKQSGGVKEKKRENLTMRLNELDGYTFYFNVSNNSIPLEMVRSFRIDGKSSNSLRYLPEDLFHFKNHGDGNYSIRINNSNQIIFKHPSKKSFDFHIYVFLECEGYRRIYFVHSMFLLQN